jgi:hypothetical protein
MFESTTTTKHSPAGVEDLPPAKVPWSTTSVEALSNYRLHVRFADGVEGIVEMREQIFSERGGVFRSLADPAEFTRVGIEHGAVVWANGVDIAPDATHDDIQRDGIRILR